MVREAINPVPVMAKHFAPWWGRFVFMATMSRVFPKTAKIVNGLKYNELYADCKSLARFWFSVCCKWAKKGLM